MKTKLLTTLLVTVLAWFGTSSIAQVANTEYGNYTLSFNTGDYNSAFGDHALYSNTTGSRNIAFGASAMQKNTTGSYNTASGTSSLYNNTSGSYNAASGFQALYTNTTGYENTAIGTKSLFKNTTGYYNTANGAYSLYSNTTGYFNTAYGYQSLYSNTTGSDNTAIGLNSLYNNTTGSGNIALGRSPLFNNTTGSYNIAIGFTALINNTTGIYNTATGHNGLYWNTTGNYNSATGAKALFYNTTGTYNVACGYLSLYSNTTGNYNTSTGAASLYLNTTGSANTANGDSALYLNTTGSNNTAYGWQALFVNATGSNNTAMGYKADVTRDSLKNATAIGYNAKVNASNRVRIGNTAVTSIGGQVGWTTFSDGRYKKDIKENIPGLSFINKLRPISYKVNLQGLNAFYEKGKKVASTNEDNIAADAASKIVHSGFIAQEVEKAAKELDFDFGGVDKPASKDDLYGLRYENFIVPLVKAVQELSKENDELRSRLDKLETLLSQQTSQSSELSNKAMLKQNIPNPAKGATTIRYSVPSYTGSAYINVYSSSNALIRSINIASKGSGSVDLKMSELSSGIYQYALIVDGKVVDRKQMVITR